MAREKFRVAVLRDLLLVSYKGLPRDRGLVEHSVVVRKRIRVAIEPCLLNPIKPLIEFVGLAHLIDGTSINEQVQVHRILP